MVQQDNFQSHLTILATFLPSEMTSNLRVSLALMLGQVKL